MTTDRTKKAHVSQKELARWLGLGTRHVRELTTKGVLEQTADGYDIRASVRAYLTFFRSKTGSISTERARLLKSQADMAELKVRQRNGELVEQAVVEKTLFEMVRQSRDLLQNVPSRTSGLLAAETDQAKIHALLTKEIHSTLTELTHAGPRP